MAARGTALDALMLRGAATAALVTAAILWLLPAGLLLRWMGAFDVVAAGLLWIASWNPSRHWAGLLAVVLVRLCLVGLLITAGAAEGLLPLAWMAATGLTTGLGLFVLGRRLRAHVEAEPPASPPLATVLPATLRQGHWLVVLLRHAGCTFCRETLARVVEHAPAIAASGHRLAFVHMGDDGDGATLAGRYGLGAATWISDPQRQLYQALGVPRGGLRQMFGPRIWWRGFVAGVVRGHWVGGLSGDGFQLGGVVALAAGRPTVLHRAVDAADLGDWPALVARLPAATNEVVL